MCRSARGRGDRRDGGAVHPRRGRGLEADFGPDALSNPKAAALKSAFQDAANDHEAAVNYMAMAAKDGNHRDLQEYAADAHGMAVKHRDRIYAALVQLRDALLAGEPKGNRTAGRYYKSIDDTGDESPHAALTLAMVDVALHFAEHDEDPTPALNALADLGEDPAKLEETLGVHSPIAKSFGAIIYKAWDDSLHPRDDNGRFVGKEKLQAAKNDPDKAKELRKRVTDPAQRAKLEKVLSGHVDPGHTKRSQARADSAERKAKRAESLKVATRLAVRAVTNEAEGHEFAGLVEHLPNLTVNQLRDLRSSLGASVPRSAKRDALVAGLVSHAMEQSESPTRDYGPEPVEPRQLPDSVPVRKPTPADTDMGADAMDPQKANAGGSKTTDTIDSTPDAGSAVSDKAKKQLGHIREGYEANGTEGQAKADQIRAEGGDAEPIFKHGDRVAKHDVGLFGTPITIKGTVVEKDGKKYVKTDAKEAGGGAIQAIAGGGDRPSQMVPLGDEW